MSASQGRWLFRGSIKRKKYQQLPAHWGMVLVSRNAGLPNAFVFLPSLGLLAALLLGASSVHAQNTQIGSFAKARKLLPQVYASHEQTFYCGCPYTDTTVDFTSCGYHPKGKPETARRLQWEHVVPAENFGRSFPEWREGAPACVDNKGNAFKGRNCASKVSATYRFMEADLYN